MKCGWGRCDVGARPRSAPAATEGQVVRRGQVEPADPNASDQVGWHCRAEPQASDQVGWHGRAARRGRVEPADPNSSEQDG
jgi:hypothetical protein